MPDEIDELLDGETLDLDGLGFPIPAEYIIEMNGVHSLLNHTTYEISLVHELDGLYDDLLTTPEMASEKAGGILWVAMTSGFFHRVRLEAADDRQYYHVRFCEATMVYQGQLS